MQNQAEKGIISPLNIIYDDCYFSSDNGLAESACVFIEGNNLIDRIGTINEINIGETGFGTGLNLLATILAFDGCDKALELHWWSVENSLCHLNKSLII